MKSEPDVFSLQDLKKRPKQEEPWNGVRNYQARNHMRDLMSLGDRVLFYHSRAETIGVAGLAEISRTAVSDPSALDPKSDYFDAKASPQKNPWVMVFVHFVAEFKRVVSRDELAAAPGLENMLVLKRGIRLSVQPVTMDEYSIVKKLGLSL